ncbi:uncharacterized protein [Clytia hemisphaerica]|uniref:Gustatory receptor n=1 Tax=Clytia hemisphaerica TaxID=252671 RepID=A0A7M5X3K7_9CNID|eukprot:TCONS_00006486-protein
MEKSTHTIRPCRLMLRGLALWQPINASLLMRMYNRFGYVMLILLVTAIIYFYNIENDNKFYWKKSVNGVIFSATFAVAFFCTKWYYRKGNYSKMLEIELGPERVHCAKLVKRYNLFALLLWVVCAGQLLWNYFYELQSFHGWYWVVYVYLAVIGNGWRICWLILYAYICHVHWRLIQSIHEKFRRYRNEPIEAEQIEDLMQRFNVLKKKLNKSERALHGIISLSVAIHVVDMTVYSFAFFSGAFHSRYHENVRITIYLLEILMQHILCLFIKLIPAAIVNSSLRKLVILVGDMCSPLRGEIRDQMMLYQQHIHITEQDMGYRILGVKITARLTGYLLTTLVSVLIAIVHVDQSKQY